MKTRCSLSYLQGFVTGASSESEELSLHPCMLLHITFSLILFFQTHFFPNFFSSGFLTSILYVFLTSFTRVACPTYFILIIQILYLMKRINYELPHDNLPGVSSCCSPFRSNSSLLCAQTESSDLLGCDTMYIGK